MVVVGAGVAGMSAAIQLAEKGIPVKIIEAGDGVGGRVRTDNVDGFLCDRGFQIFLTSYPGNHTNPHSSTFPSSLNAHTHHSQPISSLP